MPAEKPVMKANSWDDGNADKGKFIDFPKSKEQIARIAALQDILSNDEDKLEPVPAPAETIVVSNLFEATPIQTDDPASTIFVPLIGGPGSPEAKQFRGLDHASAQLIMDIADRRIIISEKDIFRNFEGGVNIRFSVIDSSLRHAFRITVLIQNTTGDSDIPDLEGEIWYYMNKGLKRGDQIQSLQITEVRKADASSSDPSDDDVEAIDLIWESSGRFVVKFNRINRRWSPQTKASVKMCRSLSRPGIVHIAHGFTN